MTPKDVQHIVLEIEKAIAPHKAEIVSDATFSMSYEEWCKLVKNYSFENVHYVSGNSLTIQFSNNSTIYFNF